MPKAKTIARIGLVLGVVPFLIKAYEYGPPAGAVAAPGDSYKTACVSSGCHVGTPNSGPGSVKIVLPAGNAGTYVPGQAMQIQVTITDATKAAYGFELTARSGTGNLTQAGDFSTTDASTQVICSDDSNKDNGKACPAKFPIQYIEHTLAGFQQSQVAKSGSYTYTMQWTPPASAVGPVTLYVAGNSGIAGPGTVTPTDIYTANVVLQPGQGNPNTPSITPGGIVPIGSTVSTIQSGSWVAMYGNNLATSTATWNGDFPTSLGGASVTVNGKSAYFYYASPGQVNFQAPDDVSTGSVNVVVTTSAGTATSTVTLASAAPSFPLLDAKHPAAIILRSDGSGAFGLGTYDILGPTGTSLGYKTVAAKAGDNLVLFGVGFGPTTPAVPAGKPFASTAPTNNPVTFNVGGKTVTPDFAGLSSAGLYQFNIKVPAGLATGEVNFTASVAGATSPQFVLSLQ
jgi:uncharacterized protein (TIGR03437 family)